METRNSNHSNNESGKPCRNGCGKHIRWDTIQNAFLEIDTIIATDVQIGVRREVYKHVTWETKGSE